MAVRPISLRLRHHEVTNRARELLRRLDKELLAQRRVKLLAAKALSAIFEMDDAAAPKLKKLSTSDRDRWQADRELIVSTLLKMSKRGV
jgi:hypothetical protein